MKMIPIANLLKWKVMMMKTWKTLMIKRNKKATKLKLMKMMMK